jgi:type VI secretion system secreted protein Hcp
MKKHAAIIFLAFTCFFGIANSANSETMVFLKIDGIPGESNVQRHEKEIDLLTWSWELTNEGSIYVGGGRSSSRPDVGPIIVTKYIDKASPILHLALLMGRHFKEALLVMRRGGEDNFDYLHIEMFDVIVTKISNGGMSNDYRFTESVSLDFSRVCYSYTPQRDDGSGDAEIRQCFDMNVNRSF